MSSWPTTNNQDKEDITYISNGEYISLKQTNPKNFVYFTFQTLYYDDRGKKQMRGKPRSWHGKTKEEYARMCKTYHKGYAILTGEINNITVYDFDNTDTYFQYLEKYPILKEAYTVKTKRGYHVYLKYDSRIRNTTNDEVKIDTRGNGGIVYGPGTNIESVGVAYEIINNGRIDIDIPDELYKLALREEPKQKPEKINMNLIRKKESNKKDLYLIEILNNINLEQYCSNYDQWLKFIWAIKFSVVDDEEQGLQLADEYSQNIRGYSGIEDVRKYFNQASEQRIGFGYLKSLSSISNRVEHIRIMKKYTCEIGSSDYQLARIALEMLDDVVVKNNDELYCYENPYWKKDLKGETICRWIRNNLREFISVYLKDILCEMNKCSEERLGVLNQKKKLLDECLNKINSHRGSQAILADFIQYLPDQDKIKFDTYKPYYFCFENVAFDLQTNRQVRVEKTDYITQHTGYPWVESTAADDRVIEKLWNEILPDEDARLCFISVFRTTMIGRLYEKFIMANGCGGNGKTTLTGLLRFMLGNQYFYRGSITTITDNMKPGANPAIANMHNKRCVLFSEPNDCKPLNIGTIKCITGDGEINARGLYKSDTICRLPITCLFECNKKPNINGRIDMAIIRRFINIFFPSTFTDNPSLYENEEGYYKADIKYKDEKWQNDNKCALFSFLLKFDYLDIYEPQSVRDATREYLMDNDEFSIFMDNFFEETTDKKDFVSIKEMTNIYKNHHLKPGTREYRGVTKKKFMDLMKGNIKWNKKFMLNYKDRHQYIGEEGKSKSERDVIVGVKRREVW